MPNGEPPGGANIVEIKLCIIDYIYITIQFYRIKNNKEYDNSQSLIVSGASYL